MNERLKKIADLIDREAFSLDVGCDHALLDIYLVQEKGHKKVAASDNKEGPLEKALFNMKKAGCADQIELLFGNGLAPYHEGIDTIVISGMGGQNILGILKDGKKVLKRIETLILSPNNYQPLVRKEVSKMGFRLVDEYLIEERKNIYTILKFERGKGPLSKRDILFGPILRERREVLFLKQLAQEKRKRELLLKLMPKTLFRKRWRIKKEYRWILEELKAK